MNFEEDIKQCVEVLSNGGTILYPTDTVWGIGCDATNPDAVKKVYALKNRDDSKALIVLAATERDIIQHTAAVDLSLFDYLDTIEKPTTVIYENGLGFAENLLAADGSIAIRICDDAFCKALIKRFGKPIVSTSANISGEPAPPYFSLINETIISGTDYVVQFRQDDETPAQPSAIIRWKNGLAEVIRA
ncbi:MAG TPA: L-threonylcarbamoyladenylate synthase [Niabella sp.]|nr:L-threonylcarbamoyladenylate synthase [Niabella sp.]HOZ96578.1 L-threonylcarbamoyladenylate synthase [Niabella sp.]HQW13241.1 L-threonylcarbamoyladenylate synthase [Niabella sp.]HQX18719.1 L-threonylcarbamoyladenylate synthase [Niabella sp.]HQX41859.1 L-threonylcarbamoyladenylate synthase [Niabella sp.]